MTYDILPFPRNREVIVDAGYLAARRHIIHGLIEVDVTLARQRIKDEPGKDGRPLSFTAFIIASFSRAIQSQPLVQAYRDLRGRLVVFHDVDVAYPIEPQPGAAPVPHVIRAANRKSVEEITDEIRSVQTDFRPDENLRGLAGLAPRLPRFSRLLFMRVMKLNPQWVKQLGGTVTVTSVGMFGKRGGWGIAFLMTHNLSLTVGGITSRPVVYEGTIAVRECLDLTLSFDHDVVDGAPAARFARNLIDEIETAIALE